MSEFWDEEEDEAQRAEERQFEAERRRLRRRRSVEEARGNWYLLTGFILGLAIGLLSAWYVVPVQYVDTDPSVLGQQDKEQYRRVIALAYSANRNLERARQRIQLIDPENPVQQLAAQAQQMLAKDQPSTEARALALLAADLNRPGLPIVPSLPAETGQTQTPPEASITQPAGTGPDEEATQEISAAIQTPTLPLPTSTPTVTATAVPTIRPTATRTQPPVLEAPYTLQSRRAICDNTAPAGLLQVLVAGADGTPQPGVRINVAWENQEDVFYTGLNPEVGPGYADFQMETGKIYSVRVGEVSDVVKDVRPQENCALRLEYVQTKSGTD
jgi:hypothetical protein